MATQTDTPAGRSPACDSFPDTEHNDQLRAAELEKMTETEDWWFKTSLPRRYNFPEPRPYDSLPYGEELWTLIWHLCSSQVGSPLRDHEMSEVVRQRTTGYIVSRLIVEARRVRRGFSDEPLGETAERYLTQLLDDLVDRILDVSEANRNRASDLLLKITRRLSLKQGEATPGQANAIETFAEASGHRCYICAAPLRYRPFDEKTIQHLTPDKQESAAFEHNRRRYELEHIYPQSKGGTRSPHNLASCCRECNKFKDDLTTFAELQIEPIIVVSDDPTRVKETFGARQRFGLFWRQQGRCRSCAQPFYEKHDERLFVVRREKSDAYHFLNTQIICGECHDLGDYEGFHFRDN